MVEILVVLGVRRSNNTHALGDHRDLRGICINALDLALLCSVGGYFCTRHLAGCVTRSHPPQLDLPGLPMNDQIPRLGDAGCHT